METIINVGAMSGCMTGGQLGSRAHLAQKRNQCRITSHCVSVLARIERSLRPRQEFPNTKDCGTLLSNGNQVPIDAIIHRIYCLVHQKVPVLPLSLRDLIKFRSETILWLSLSIYISLSIFVSLSLSVYFSSSRLPY